jgi:plastocyanin
MRWETASGLLAACMLAAGCGAPAAAPGVPAASVAPPVVELALTARQIAFEPASLTVATGTTLVIAFDNLDPGTPHALALFADPALTIKLAEAPILVGADRARFEIAPLVVGRYLFGCLVHPIMTADLVVTPS